MEETDAVDSVLELLAVEELDLEALIVALTPYGEEGGPRPWLPPLPQSTEAWEKAWSSVVDRVIPLVGHESLMRRHRAVKVLARIPTESAAEGVVEALHDPMSIVVADALDAVVRGAPVEAADLLVEMLNHEDLLVRLRAAGNLGPMGNPDAVEALVSTLEDADEDEYVRAWAATSLGDLPTPEALTALRDAADLPNEVIFEGIRRGLERHIPLTLADLGMDRPPLRRLQAARTFLDEDPNALLVLLDLYADLEAGLGARQVLMAIPEESLTPLAEVILGTSDRVAAAVDVVGQRGLRASLGSLEDLRDSRGEPGLALLAGIALIRLDVPDATERLMARWASFSADARAEGILGGMFANDRIPSGVLGMLIGDPCAAVTAAGAELLRRDHDSPFARAMLIAALALELERLQGTAPPRPPEEAGPVGTPDFVDEYALQSALFQGNLPDSLLVEAEALDSGVGSSPEMVAGRALLWACVSFPGTFDEVLGPWMDLPDPLLRLDALRVWAALNPDGLPPVDLSNDSDPTVRGFYALILEDA